MKGSFFLLVVLGMLGACATAPEKKSVPIDATGELIPRDGEWENARDHRLAAFKQATGESILLRFVATSPTEAEDKVPGVFMKAMATQLGVAKRGALVVHFSDEDDGGFGLATNLHRSSSVSPAPPNS